MTSQIISQIEYPIPTFASFTFKFDSNLALFAGFILLTIPYRGLIFGPPCLVDFKLVVAICRPRSQISQVLGHRLHCVSCAAWCTSRVSRDRGAASRRSRWTRALQCCTSRRAIRFLLFVAEARAHRT